MNQGVYVWRTRKPTAIWGLPIIGRHFGYVGETSSFGARERQHMGRPRPGDRYPTKGQPWSDLDPKCYRIPLPGRWMRKTAEALLIWALLPVYNIKLNRINPRRIRKERSLAQRARRDSARNGSKLAMVTGPALALRWWHGLMLVTTLAAVWRIA
jgi:hypothetical protein